MFTTTSSNQQKQVPTNNAIMAITSNRTNQFTTETSKKLSVRSEVMGGVSYLINFKKVTTLSQTI
jgi:hypothetical protein